MTDKQWHDLLRIFDGEQLDPLPVGFIIDSPWLPGWAGISILDYYTSESRWLETNLRAVRRFSDVLFLPGFWAEFGMCGEPSAFGAKCVWPDNEFPFANKMFNDPAETAKLVKPNCLTDGLCPHILKRLSHQQAAIEEEGHRIRFAVSRGPHNIASFLLGHTEMLMAVKTHPEELARMLAVITEFVVDWLQLQAKTFPSIEGMLVLDDLIGFIGGNDFRDLVVPYFKQVSDALDVPVKALHNDAHGLVTAKHLGDMGFNLFNFAFDHSLGQIRELVGPEVVLLGNIPPRDVLAQGSPDDVRRSVAEAITSINDHRRILFSCGGGMPPEVSSANVDAFCSAVIDGSA